MHREKEREHVGLPGHTNNPKPRKNGAGKFNEGDPREVIDVPDAIDKNDPNYESPIAEVEDDLEQVVEKEMESTDDVAAENGLLE